MNKLQQQLNRVVRPWLVLLLMAATVTSRAQAQGPAPTVSISRVDSSAFPQVTAYLSVTDENGQPVPALAELDFTVQENGLPVDSSLIQVAPEPTLQALRVVLALDTSVDPNSMAFMKSAVNTFLDSLLPEDQVAIITFSNDVQLLQPSFTVDRQSIRTALDGVVPAGDFTVLNQAALAAVELAAPEGQGRPVVVILTNSADNVANPDALDAGARAMASGIPLYLFGFGPGATPESLNTIARQARGTAYIIPDAAQLPGAIQPLASLLHQGYRLTFTSAIQADNNEHELSIAARYLGQESQTTSRFVAESSDVTVLVRGLADGRTVAGDVNLTAQTIATTAIESVTYYLNGELLGESTTPPFALDWDSTSVEPGGYTLRVVASDTAGNLGETEVAFAVATPISLVVRSPEDPITIGQEAVIEAEVEALTGVASVKFLLGEVLLASDTMAPYRLALDTNPYQAGAQPITVRAEDILGRVVASTVTLQLAPAGSDSRPAPTSVPVEQPITDASVQPGPTSTQSPAAVSDGAPAWIRYGAIALIVLSVILTGILLRAISRAEKRSRRRRFRISLNNEGNVRSRYTLRADDPTQSLRFQFLVDGLALPQTVSTKQIQLAAPESPRGTPAFVPVAVAPPAGRAPAHPDLGSAQGMQQSNAFIDLLSTITYMLPTSMRTPFYSLLGNLRQGQFAATRVSRLPGMVGGLMPKRSAPQAATPGAARYQSSTSPAYLAATAVPSPQSTLSEEWLETPFVEPGDSLPLELIVDPVRRPRSEAYPFRVLSRPAEMPDSALIVEKGMYQGRASGFFQRYGFAALFVATIGLMSMAIVLLVTSSGLAG